MAKLLLLDDDTAALEWMSMALSGLGHEVRAHRDVRAALAQLSTWRPDLIVSDVLMPEIDGLAFARLLRAHGGPPIIFISIAMKQADAILAGASGYVQKPAEARDVRAAVTKVLGQPPHRATILVVDDDADTRELYRTYLEPTFNVEEAEDGFVALRKLHRLPIDLVITDFHMPIVNGGELIREIRADPKLERMPVILQTSDRLVLSSPLWRDLKIAYKIDKYDFLDWLRRHIDATLTSDVAANAKD